MERVQYGISKGERSRRSLYSFEKSDEVAKISVWVASISFHLDDQEEKTPVFARDKNFFYLDIGYVHCHPSLCALCEKFSKSVNESLTFPLFISIITWSGRTIDRILLVQALHRWYRGWDMWREKNLNRVERYDNECTERIRETPSKKRVSHTCNIVGLSSFSERQNK